MFLKRILSSRYYTKIFLDTFLDSSRKLSSAFLFPLHLSRMRAQTLPWIHKCVLQFGMITYDTVIPWQSYSKILQPRMLPLPPSPPPRDIICTAVHFLSGSPILFTTTSNPATVCTCSFVRMHARVRVRAPRLRLIYDKRVKSERRHRVMINIFDVACTLRTRDSQTTKARARLSAPCNLIESFTERALW